MCHQLISESHFRSTSDLTQNASHYSNLVDRIDDGEQDDQLDRDRDGRQRVLVDVDQLDAEEDTVVGQAADGPGPDEEQEHSSGNLGAKNLSHLEN